MVYRWEVCQALGRPSGGFPAQLSVRLHDRPHISAAAIFRYPAGTRGRWRHRLQYPCHHQHLHLTQWTPTACGRTTTCTHTNHPVSSLPQPQQLLCLGSDGIMGRTELFTIKKLLYLANFKTDKPFQRKLEIEN